MAIERSMPRVPQWDPLNYHLSRVGVAAEGDHVTNLLMSRHHAEYLTGALHDDQAPLEMRHALGFLVAHPGHEGREALAERGERLYGMGPNNTPSSLLYLSGLASGDFGYAVATWADVDSDELRVGAARNMIAQCFNDPYPVDKPTATADTRIRWIQPLPGVPEHLRLGEASTYLHLAAMAIPDELKRSIMQQLQQA